MVKSKEKAKRLRAKKCEVCGTILTEEKIQNGIKELSDRISKWCYILHDKDVKEDGTPKEPHYHCFIQFITDVDFTLIAKAFDCEITNVRFIECKFYEGCIPYLIHLKQPEKYQYAP